MTYRRARLGWGVLAVCGVLLAGCTGGGGDGTGTKGGGPSGTGVTTPSPDADQTPAPELLEADPDKQPTTTAEGRALVAKLSAGTDLFAAGVEKADPYESDPSRWAVLGEDCVWQREPLPESVLATLTRHFEVPEAGGKGLVRISSTVTVHRTADEAGWEQAGMLEEAVGCGEQVLSGGERLTGLISLASRWGEGNNMFSEDSLVETGQCVSEEHGGPYEYWWSQATFGPVTAATSVCGGKGYSQPELTALVEKALPRILLRAQEELGRPAEGKDGSASPAPAATGSAAEGDK